MLKRSLLILSLLGTSAMADEPQKLTFTIDIATVNVIGEALGAMPYNKAAPVINELQRQAAAQHPPVPPVADKAVKPEK